MNCLDLSTISKEWKSLIEQIPRDIIGKLEIDYTNSINLYSPHLSILPDKNLRLACMKYFNPNDTKVVIIGQDPYISPEQPMGLSFSVPKGIRIPPSLINIYKELESDIPNFIRPIHGDLTEWAKQGVLLLNISLTVVEKLSNSHSKIWADFMRYFLNIFSNDNPNIVYILMGKEAQKVKQYINNGIFIETAHPSPLARGAFFGSKPFSKANLELTKLGKTVIDWTKF
jgi:uracil-DNA glycosylase